jgi:hypothetical protein
VAQFGAILVVIECRVANDSEEDMARAATKPKRKLFYATIQATRLEEWFVEAQTADEARALLESGAGHRVQVGQCVHFEIDTLSD